MSLDDIRRDHAAALRGHFGAEPDTLTDVQVQLWASRNRSAISGEPAPLVNIDRDRAGTFRL